MQIDFEDQKDLSDAITNYIQEKNYEAEQTQTEQEQNEKEKQEKLKQKRDEKWAQYTKKIEEQHNLPYKQFIAQPKDKYRVGKEILKLQKLFPKDKLLRRLILEEFKDNKLVKLPLEYDVYDPDEEARIKERKGNDPQFIENPDTRKCQLTIQELERPKKERVQQISQMFEKNLQDYCSQKKSEMDDAKRVKQQQAKEDRLMKRYIQLKAVQFINQRKKRFEEKIPTLNEFLSSIHKEMLTGEHKESCKRNFPYLRYGEASRKFKTKLMEQSKKKWKLFDSYPMALKKYFFKVVRQIIRADIHNLEKDKHEKLPFWAPPSKQNMCRVHVQIDCPPGCQYQTCNKKVVALSRDLKEAEEFKQKQSYSAWDNEQLEKEKLNFLMKFSDATHCTFQPAILKRLPQKKINIMKEKKLGYNWVQEKVDNPDTKFEDWLKKMGPNFKNRYPKIYKLGVLKRVQLFIRKQDYRTAMLRLREAFNVEHIKKEIEGPNYKPCNDPESLFYHENLGLDPPEQQLQKMPNEDFDKPDSRAFLNDVYAVIKQLENQELGMRKAIKAFEEMR